MQKYGAMKELNDRLRIKCNYVTDSLRGYNRLGAYSKLSKCVMDNKPEWLINKTSQQNYIDGTITV